MIPTTQGRHNATLESLPVATVSAAMGEHRKRGGPSA